MAADRFATFEVELTASIDDGAAAGLRRPMRRPIARCTGNPPVCVDWLADGRPHVVRVPLRGQAGWTGHVTHVRLIRSPRTPRRPARRLDASTAAHSGGGAVRRYTVIGCVRPLGSVATARYSALNHG